MLTQNPATAPDATPPTPAVSLPAVWRIAAPNDTQVQALVRALDLSPITAALLVNRGVTTPDAARAFFNPTIDTLSDPYRFPDMEAAVDRLAHAVEKGETIFVHGDYDVDGVTSAALAVRALTGLGAKVVGFVPSRADGYDLQKGGVDKAKAAGATLLFTADCAIKAVEAVAYASEQGIDVVVTDHHRPGATIPAACAVVNPYRTDAAAIERTSVLGFYDYVGVAVAYKVLGALTQRLRPDAHAAFLSGFLDFVALGTVQDMACVTGENRVFVTHGLDALSRSKRKGIQALLTHFKLGGESVTAEHIGWKIGPLLNAAGRMDDANLAYRLLVTREADDAEQLVAQLDGLNALRKQEQAKIVAEAAAQATLPEYADRRVLVLTSPGWRGGLAGLAAGRIADQFTRPTLLLSHNPRTNEYHGSARGYGDFHMLNALTECDKVGMLGRYGGHSGAAGVTVRGEHFEAFCEKLHELAEGTVDLEPTAPVLAIDAEVPDGRAWTYEMMDEIARLEPYGRGNAEPVFATCGARVQDVRRCGSDKNTLQMRVELPGMAAPTSVVGFKMGALADNLSPGMRVDLAYKPNLNHYNGRTTIQLMLEDARLAGTI